MTRQRRYWKVLFGALGLLALQGSGPVLGAQETACWSGDRGARVWPAITFQRAVDLDDFRRTFAQSRDQVRQTLEGEYLQLLRELTVAGGKPEQLAEQVMGAILAFDELHDLRRDKAVAGLPVFLEAGIRTALDQLYRSNRIPNAERRLQFVGLGLAERMGAAREGLRAAGGPTQGDLEVLQEATGQTDLFAYGTFSADGEQLSVALTLENPRTGSLCEFGVTAAVEEIPYLLAERLFQAFQAVEYPAVRNPNPNLTWIRPYSNARITDPEQARYYCASQGEGVRLPYALELVNAAQVGTEGAAYVAGGIPQLEPGPWVVADRLEREGQYYYFQPQDGDVDTHPAGAVRSGAGLGEMRARYWCVEGEPSPRVTEIERLYEIYRRVSRAAPNDSALLAVRYLLTRERAMSAQPRYRAAFPDEITAEIAVEQACFALEERAAGEAVIVAGLTCSVEGEH